MSTFLQTGCLGEPSDERIFLETESGVPELAHELLQAVRGAGVEVRPALADHEMC